LAIEFSHEFDPKYYIGTFADPKPSFETQINSPRHTYFQSCSAKSTDFIGFLLNPIWGTSEIFELTTEQYHTNFSQLSSSMRSKPLGVWYMHGACL
jgi:hypothetical protein